MCGKIFDLNFAIRIDICRRYHNIRKLRPIGTGIHIDSSANTARDSMCKFQPAQAGFQRGISSRYIQAPCANRHLIIRKNNIVHPIRFNYNSADAVIINKQIGPVAHDKPRNAVLI